MDAPTTVVWIATDPPDTPQRQALASWAAAHDVRLVDPPDVQAVPLASDGRVPGEVEDLLERARDAIAALDAAGIDAALASGEAVLRGHPALPQAAWLMAEIERARAVRWRRVPPTDAEAADRAWRRAEALDGGRLPDVGEEAPATGPPEASVDLAADLGAEEQRWLDGRPVGEHVQTRAGLHSLVVTWAGAPVWGTWVDIPPGRSKIELEAPRAEPCSRADVGSARPAGERVAAELVRCGNWIAVAPGVHSTHEVRVARCEGGRCGALVDWRSPEPWTEPLPARPAEKRWPAWATWSAVGAGAAIATGTAIVLVNALHTPAAETRFVNGGIKQGE